MGYTSSNTALIVIDIQKGFFRAATSVYNAESFLNTVEMLINEAHEANIQVIHVQRYYEVLVGLGEKSMNMHPRINLRPNDIVLRKEQISAFQNTNLHEILQSKKIERIVVTGLMTQGAIKSTCRDGKALGYDVVLVADGHTNNNQNAPQVIREWNETLASENISVLKAEEIHFI
ncbi:MAG: cysteine hydrolase [Clostridiales bacterium]|nr:cysteine hydrolase [Clostridiales bacterium]